MAKRRKRPPRPTRPSVPRPALPPGWLTVDQVARRYGVTHSAICHHLRNGSLPGLKFNNAVWIVREQDLPAELPPVGRPPLQ